MADNRGLLEDDELQREQIILAEIIDPWVDEVCVICKNVISAEDVVQMLDDACLVSQDHESFTSAPRCYTCCKDYLCEQEGVKDMCK